MPQPGSGIHVDSNAMSVVQSPVESDPIVEPTITASPNGESLARFAWVDILRGLSAFGVVLFHSRVDLYAGWNEIRANPAAYSAFDRLGAYLSLPLSFLGSGVMLFFLLSGFCVHYPYANGRKQFAGKEYAARRFLRIYLPYIAVIAFTLLAEWAAKSIASFEPSTTSTVVRSALMIQNYGPNAGQMTGNPSLWSLPVEIELYAVYPIFLWLLRKYSVKAALSVTATVSALAGIAMLSSGTFPHGGFLPFWAMWCFGAAMAEWAATGRLPQWRSAYWLLAASSLLVAIGAQLKVTHPMAAQYAWAVFFSIVLLFGLTSASVRDWSLGSKAGRLAAFGAITYSLYLVHFPVLRVLGALWTNFVGEKSGNLLVPVTGALLCIPVAILFYRLIEKPSHEISRRAGKALETSP